MAALGVAAVCAAVGGLRPVNAVNITVYHINPLHEGPIPINMDTGDLVGDLYFDVQNMDLPLKCAQTPNSTDCHNQELTDHDLVVNKVTLEVEDDYSTYAMCNIGKNGTDGWGDPCKDDEYCCVCRDKKNWTQKVPCDRTLGRESPATSFAPWYVKQCNDSVPDWMCFNAHVAGKFANSTNFWYSSLLSGYCDAANATQSSCKWRVVGVDKVVNRTCQADRFHSTIEHRGESCFERCPGGRNTSSPCWLHCYYVTTLGPHAGKPGGAIEGMPVQELSDAWSAAFLPEDQGGCPSLL
eukprot:Hpha_TRINITY_DN11283_c0_g1::TRINITY_DN11283_c0_g1_i1::g.167459::m.167459